MRACKMSLSDVVVDGGFLRLMLVSLNMSSRLAVKNLG